jgi:hypothetical protein
MTDSQEDIGVITVILERLADQRLPRVLDIKEKVDGGAKLGSTDLEYLDRIFADTAEVQRMLEINPHPEYDDLIARVSQLYNDITRKALENEQRG